MQLRHGCGALLDLEDVRSRLGLIEQSYSGVHPVPLEQVVGTVGRAQDFDRCFNPLRPSLRERLRRVEQAFKDGAFPPIDAYRIDSAFFVADGHHRVAAARKMKMATIDAIVTLVHTPYRVDPEVDMESIVLTEHERRFLRSSGLMEARPEARIPLSTPDGYSELLEAVKAYGFDLMEKQQKVMARAEVSASWFDCVYLPTTRFSKEARLCDLLPSCTLGDLFLAVHRQHRATFDSECEAAEAAIRRAIREQQDSVGSAPSRMRAGSRRTHSPRRPLDSS
jgi:hypothetical protein